MSAGTVVILGGTLAAVILLCIISVLCYCQLQPYCCECDVSESVAAPVLDYPRVHYNVCSMGGVSGTLLPLTFNPCVTHSYCSACLPYHCHDEVCNGNTWLAVTGQESHQGVTALGTAAMMNFYTCTHIISTDV